MDLQGLVSYPGISIFNSASFTFSRGISPSVCTIATVPHSNFIGEVGDLTFTFGSEKIRFRDCAVNRASLAIGGGQTWTIQILDRRWKWAFGEISGRYNVRLADNTIDTETEKNPQELAKLLLDAMGEQSYNVSAMPKDPRPEVKWDANNPARELAELCDETGCEIVLGLDNRVRIVLQGKGANLPNLSAEMNEGFGYTRAARPDSIKIVCGPTQFAGSFGLEAVGLDTDKQVRRIDDLSYTPTTGWEKSYPENFYTVLEATTENKPNRELALQTVFRWYRIKEPTVTIQLAEEPNLKIRHLWQVLPLLDEIPELVVIPENRIKPADALKADDAEPNTPYITGEFFWYGQGYTNSPQDMFYGGDFTLDRKRGIVVFRDPVTLRDYDTGDTAQADLKLTCGFNVQDENKRLVRFQHERKMPWKKTGTGPLIVQRPDLILVYEGKTPKNKAEILAECDKAIDDAQRSFDYGEAVDVTYAGLIPIDLDGAIQQVTWTVSNNGAETRASRNVEHLVGHREQRRIERAERRREKARMKGDE